MNGMMTVMMMTDSLEDQYVLHMIDMNCKNEVNNNTGVWRTRKNGKKQQERQVEGESSCTL